MHCTLSNRIETDYYVEIAKELVVQVESNIEAGRYVVKSLIGEIYAALNTLLANGYDAGALLKKYALSLHRLHLDISILIEDTVTGKFELVIFEIKRVKTMGLTNLSQLIGYCLVSKAKFGILMNVDYSISNEFAVILNGDRDLTHIVRLLEGEELHHKFGVMIWNSTTRTIEYTAAGSIKSIPELVELMTESLQ